jgi:two-component system, OmpR family, phosphate regulon sensor histidine kinase PhoR
MPSTYARGALTLAYIAALSAVAGAVFGPAVGWALACLLLLLLLAHHLRHLEQLRRWAASTHLEPVPEGTGVWSGVFDALYRRERTATRRRGRLARLLARSRQAGRALPYGVAILDHEYRIVWCNDSSESHFGIRLAEDRRQIITHLVRQPDFVAYLAAADYAKPLELRAAERILAVQFVPYADGQWLLLSRDVTQAARLEAMRRDFVANVSHELRTPLTVLVGFLETLRDLDLSAERAREYLRLMTEQGERMQHIIDDLLMLSTLEAAPEPAFDTRVDVPALLQRLQEAAQALSAGRHHILASGEDFDILGAENEITSAFSNLISNAVRYTPAGGEVRITWRKLAEGAEFVVQDTGRGIAPEHIPRLTERFYRVDRGRSRETGGTGLGLAIVKHALARHQAALVIQSELGHGSRFAAHFPERRIAGDSEPVALPIPD